jgi:DegV family protein with EDD domain
MPMFEQAFKAGTERVAAWADLLDRINVFPVADGDTGRNLVISLSPLRCLNENPEMTVRSLLLAARGNSGNIANRFFSSFIAIDTLSSLSPSVNKGREAAWKAVHDPKHGTMLSLFDALDDILRGIDVNSNTDWVAGVLDHLEETVRSTPEFQPKLKQAGVVDAGALGMFIFFDGFFNTLMGRLDHFRPISSAFGAHLQIKTAFREEADWGYCIDTVLQGSAYTEETVQAISSLGDSITVSGDGHYLKVHLHARDEKDAREKLAQYGNPVHWSCDDLGMQIREFPSTAKQHGIHLMTDAAGSVTRRESRQYGFTLLDSYITIGDTSLPETFFHPEEVYQAMAGGIKVSTSQASIFERHQLYQMALDLHPQVLYLCVGSVFTGNYETAVAWKSSRDPDGRFHIIDSQAASGRLGLTFLSVVRYAQETDNAADVIQYAGRIVRECHEYIFLDSLKYLAAGGRLSKTGAFFGDLMQMKPVISPTAQGAIKSGLTRNRKDQIRFAVEKLSEHTFKDNRILIMLEYSDNLPWIQDVVKSEIAGCRPAAEIIVQPLSLTTGVHTGPGTWGIAFFPLP